MREQCLTVNSAVNAVRAGSARRARSSVVADALCYGQATEFHDREDSRDHGV